MASASPQGLPTFNATCPTNISIHGDEGGYVYINGQQAPLKKFNDNYYEANDASSGTYISISKNPDGSLMLSYTGRGGANGVCRLN